MGLFDTFGKLLSGKPVFESQNQNNHNQGAPQMTNQPQPAMHSHNGPKIIPEVYISQADCNEPGANIDLDIYVKNFSQTTVEVDKIELWGRVQELDKNLTPGMEFKFRVYSGPRLRNTADNRCRLWYKITDTGDYFISHHYIEYKQEADGTYTVNRLTYKPPVQDA